MLHRRVDRAEARTDDPGGGRGEKECAAACHADRWDRGFGRREHAAHVEIDGDVEVILGHSLYFSRPGMTQVVPDEVELSECRHRVGDDLPGCFDGAQIRANGDRPSAGIDDLLDHTLGAFGITVHHRHRRAFARESERPRPAHPGGGRGHDTGTILQSVHHGSPLSSPRRSNHRTVYIAGDVT